MNGKEFFEYVVTSEMIDGIERYGLILKVNGKETLVVHDITVDRGMIERTASLFNRGQLSPIHLADALEDLLP